MNAMLYKQTHGYPYTKHKPLNEVLHDTKRGYLKLCRNENANETDRRNADRTI